MATDERRAEDMPMPGVVNDSWHYRIEPFERAPGWWIYIVKGMIHMGPDGGPYHCWGSRERAERKARRIIARIERAEARRDALTIEGR